MEKFSPKSKSVSAGAILVLGLGISAAVMTSSANADETHAIPKIAHISHTAWVVPTTGLSTSIEAPSISGIGSEDDSEGSSLGSSSGDGSEGDSGSPTSASIHSSDD